MVGAPDLKPSREKNESPTHTKREALHRLTQPCWTTNLGKGFGDLKGMALKPGLAEPKGGEGLSRQPVIVSNEPLLGPGPPRIGGRCTKTGRPEGVAQENVGAVSLAGRLPRAASECR